SLSVTYSCISQLFFDPDHLSSSFSPFFFFNHTAPTEIYTLSLHDALPISLHDGATRRDRRSARRIPSSGRSACGALRPRACGRRSEEHTSELQSRGHLVCRLLLEKKKKKKILRYRNSNRSLECDAQSGVVI